MLSPGQFRINAQSPINDSNLLKSPVFRENFQLFSDRNIYAATESIFFRAFNVSNPELKKSDWSKILYVEIISQTNTPVAQAKYVLDECGTSGYIKIPETTATGHYYLRAYTKWMRNFSPEGYFHYPIAIINPNDNELRSFRDLPLPDTGSQQAHFEIPLNEIQFSTNKKQYHKRETGTIVLSLPEGKMPSPEGYCLTVVRQGALATAIHRMSIPGKSIPPGREDPGSIIYFPETKGISLSGRVISGNNKTPQAYTTVHMSLSGNNYDFYSSQTDTEGRFRIALPHRVGIQEAVLTADSDPDITSRIIIDNDFSNDFVPLPETSFVLSSRQKEIFRNVMINMQVEEIFSKDTVSIIPVKNNDPAEDWFYGSSGRSLKTDDFVKLPTLEEFFFELIPEVIHRKRRDQNYFIIMGDHTDLAYYKPLILLDMVPVMDVKTILQISPGRIERIDVIDAIYVRGSIRYGGVISIISYEGDRAGVGLPGNSVFCNFKTFEPQQEAADSYSDTPPESERIPDFRNCLLWVPDIKMETMDKVSINFTTSDNPETYMVVVRGISNEGEILEYQCNFIVQ